MHRIQVALCVGAWLAVGIAATARAEGGGPKSAARLQAEDHALKAQAYFKLNRFSDAESEFKLAQSTDPSWHDILFDLGVVYQAEGRDREAVDSLKSYLPYAPDAEAADLKQRIATLEIKLDDAEKAAKAQADAQADREAAANRERILAAARAEREREAAEAQAKRDATQGVTISLQQEGEEATDVGLRLADGKMLKCNEAVALGHPCVLHPPPGKLTLVWNGADDGNENLLDVPSGLSEAKLTFGHSTGSRLAVGIPSMLLFDGGLVPLLVGMSQSNGTLIALGAAMMAVGLTGGAIWLFVLLRSDSVDLKPATRVGSRPALPRFKLVALGAAPNGQGGGNAGATFSF